jgi:DNA repair exonuclease SbcCD ATPase subunit
MADYFPAALWLIPLLLLATVGGLFLLGRYLQGKAQAGLKRLRSDMRRFQSERKQLELAAESYSVNDPEPYRSQVTGLRQKLAILRRRSEQLERRHIDLHQQAADLSHNRWQTILRAPFAWHLLRQDVSSLEADLSQADLLLGQALQHESAIRGLSWEVARQARETVQCQQNASQVLNELRSANLYGDTFEAASSQEQQALTALAQIPRLYLEADEASLLEQASKENTALVYEIVRINRPKLDELLDQSQSWKTQYQSTWDSLGRMRQALDELGQTLGSTPAALDASDGQARSQQCEVIAQSLQATLSRLEVESMALVSQEAGKIAQTAQEADQSLRQARQEWSALEALQNEVIKGFSDLSLQLAALGAKSSHPVKWGVSLEQLAQLNRQANKLANTRKARTPAAVSAGLAAATQISAAQKELARRCLEIGQDHADLLFLLESPQLKQLPKWLENARQLVEQVSRYAPENWSRSDGVESLPAQVQALSEEAAHLVIDDPAEPISEPDLPARLDETRQLAQDYSQMLGRFDNVKQRLEDLQHSQEQALEQLENLVKLLTQVQLVVSSNQFLAGLAAQEIERLLANVQSLQKDLAQPQSGSVTRKVRQTGDLANRVEGFANRWLDQLGKEIQEQTKEMSGELSKLDAIARLEDASVGETRRLLSSSPAYLGAAEGRSRLSLQDTVLELKRRSGFWQECTASQNALENVRQLVETYEETGYQRQNTRELLAQASAWGGQKRSWPPNSATLEAETKEMEKIEQQFQALKEQGGKAISLVAQFSNLSTRYQTLAERLKQGAGRAAQEQSQVEDLETSISDLTGPWQDRLGEYRDNPDASLEIRELLDSVDAEMKRIRRQYTQEALDYNQVLLALRTLQRKVRFYQVALDDEHAIDASGRVTRRRQSERE